MDIREGYCRVREPYVSGGGNLRLENAVEAGYFYPDLRKRISSSSRH